MSGAVPLEGGRLSSGFPTPHGTSANYALIQHCLNYVNVKGPGWPLIIVCSGQTSVYHTASGQGHSTEPGRLGLLNSGVLVVSLTKLVPGALWS